MKRTINIFVFLLFAVIFGIAGQISPEVNIPYKVYTDRITDQTGVPLSGIHIRVKGTNISTITDANGQFMINAKNGDVIILSKNGKVINSYRLDGSNYYEVIDESGRIDQKKRNKIGADAKETSNADSEFQFLLDSANYYKKINPTRSIDLIERTFLIANETKNKKQLSDGYGVLGDVYMNLKQYDLASSNYVIAVSYAPSISNKLKLAKAYFLNADHSKSQELYHALIKDSKVGSAQKIEIYEGLGDNYYKINQLDKSFNEYQTALTLAKRLSNSAKINDLNAKISSVLEAKGETVKAESYLLSSQKSVSKKEPQKAVIENQRAANFYSRNKNIDKEVQQRQAILQNLKDADLDEVVVEDNDKALTKSKVKLDLGNAYIKQNKLDKAIPLLEESASEAESINDIETQKDAIQKLSEVYVSLGNDDKALSNYKKYVSLVDQLYRQKENEINEIVNLNKDLAEKQNRITSLEKDRELSESKLQLYQSENRLTIENERRQKIIIYALLAGLILLLFSLFWMFKSNRQRRLANNLLALKSLRTQMNPHFIFNALNSVNSFIAQNDERTANRYLTDFSTLMRSVLVNSEEDFISLEKELELLNLYLKLEHSRFKDKFDYEIIVDDQIEQDLFQIPPMLLQPYIENAVWHGLRYKKEKGFLKVALFKKDDETIIIEITDNGIGRTKSAELKTEHQKKQQSKGLDNIEQRIKILNEMYKDKVDVLIEDLYDDKTGTKVILTIKKD
ncbi:MAG: histidine kinase [Flavobacteriaceae bacterium]|nr:histidine kinase [Flavobacteriaceae bacterium]